MAEFCEPCSKELGFPEADLSPEKVCPDLQPDHWIGPLLCEHCGPVFFMRWHDQPAELYRAWKSSVPASNVVTRGGDARTSAPVAAEERMEEFVRAASEYCEAVDWARSQKETDPPVQGGAVGRPLYKMLEIWRALVASRGGDK